MRSGLNISGRQVDRGEEVRRSLSKGEPNFMVNSMRGSREYNRTSEHQNSVPIRPDTHRDVHSASTTRSSTAPGTMGFARKDDAMMLAAMSNGPSLPQLASVNVTPFGGSIQRAKSLTV
eukprot:CAMPEP_0198233714 /NCGR_PEP_ID=MMETSP1445-20131203/116382_1 /TAXON_ID=36898 /ORGANISM="Pyramimonas sp., Strain CCMP2087" /LENGTH=118 /DNA_ID=CAMNT_0043914415 /DNA_START=537 /DNA_END=889 /DNA_ORIENTATION=+